MRIVRETRGQVVVLSAVALTSLLGMSALVVDVGSWFRADRATQSTADAAVLAGAQELPADPDDAVGLALQYANANGGGLSPSNIAVSTDIDPNDTISVRVQRPAQGFFSSVLGIGSVTVGSRAVARAEGMSEATALAPIAVRSSHPLLSGGGCPCFKTPTTLPLGKTGAPGAFALVNIDGSHGGTGPQTLADWILNGLDGYLALGAYLSDPGAKWNSNPVQDALQARIGSDLLFPVYDTLTGGGADAQYRVIGWVGFHLTSFTASGNDGSLSGYFTRVIWQGIQTTRSGGGGPDFGARAVQLVN